MNKIELNKCPCGSSALLQVVEDSVGHILCRDCKCFMTTGEDRKEAWNKLKVPDYKDTIVLNTYENGDKEFCIINNTSDIDRHDHFVMFSVGYNAYDGDIEQARKELYLKKYEYQLYGKTRW